jgi:hypothetical protein
MQQVSGWLHHDAHVCDLLGRSKRGRAVIETLSFRDLRLKDERPPRVH